MYSIESKFKGFRDKTNQNKKSQMQVHGQGTETKDKLKRK